MSDQAQALAKHTAQGSALKWLILSLLIIVSDQYTKFLIIERFAEFESITLHPFLDFMRLHNEGVAFSFFDEDGGWQRWFFSGLGIVVSLVIAVWLYRIPAHSHRLLAAGLACVVGGALGNVIDRINHGHVIDFIRVHYESWYFPAFNVADSAITIGAILYIFDTIIEMGANADQQG